jgi:hypothetical protein
MLSFRALDKWGEGEGGSCFSSAEIPREDWPVTARYALSKQKSAGAILLVAGIDPIYATRQQSAHSSAEPCGNIYLGPSERFRLIAEMLDVSPEEIRWETMVQTNIEFQSLEQFNNAVLTFVEGQQQKYRATADALVDRELLTRSEALQSLPELKLQLIDMRGDGATPIPSLPNLPSRVRWSSVSD